MEVLMRYCRRHFVDPAPHLQRQAQSKLKHRSNALQHGQQIVHDSQRGQEIKIVKRRVVKKAFYSDEEDESAEEEQIVYPTYSPTRTTNNTNTNNNTNNTVELDDDEHLTADHKLLLKSSLPLLKSRNAGVVQAVCTLHYYCGTHTDKVCSQHGHEQQSHL